MNQNEAFDQLQQQVFAKTGIPPNAQQLLANTKLVKSSSNIIDNTTLNLKVQLSGGNNCDICYSFGPLFICKECEQTLCAECSYRVHQHPTRAHHKTNAFTETQKNDETLDTSGSDDSVQGLDAQLSQESEQSFLDAILIATLAEQFSLTSFKTFQKEVIDATL